MTEPHAGQTQAQNEDQYIDGWLFQIVYCTARGAISCLAHVRPEKVLLMMTVALAKVLCALYGGDELMVRRFRKTARDAFDETLKSAKVTPLPQQVTENTDAASIGGRIG